VDFFGRNRRLHRECFARRRSAQYIWSRPSCQLANLPFAPLCCLLSVRQHDGGGGICPLSRKSGRCFPALLASAPFESIPPKRAFAVKNPGNGHRRKRQCRCSGLRFGRCRSRRTAAYRGEAQRADKRRREVPPVGSSGEVCTLAMGGK